MGTHPFLPPRQAGLTPYRIPGKYADTDLLYSSNSPPNRTRNNSSSTRTRISVPHRNTTVPNTNNHPGATSNNPVPTTNPKNDA